MLIFPPHPGDFKFAEAKSPRLRIIYFSDEIRKIIVRGLTKTGLIHHAFDTDNSRTPQTQTIPITEIPLTLHVESPYYTAHRGSLFVQIVIEFAGVPATTLAADYITTHTPLSWPGSGINAPTSGRGYLHEREVDDPPVSEDLATFPPTNTLWHITGVRFMLTTSATVATRIPRIWIVGPSGQVTYSTSPTSGQPASTSFHYIFAPYNNIPAAYGAYIHGEFTPTYMTLSHQLQTSTTGIQVNDQFSLIKFQVEQWLNP